MTRFALCSTTYTLAGLIAGLPLLQAYAVGAAIATAIAVFKNSKNRKAGGGNNGKKVRFRSPSNEEREQQQSSQLLSLPTVRIGGFDVVIDVSPLGHIVARIVLGGEITTLTGTSVKGEQEFAKVPDDVKRQLWELLHEVDVTSRKVFDVYKSVRDSLSL